jgi:putative spermidine/putrescine transport system ATP-binding protein
VISTAETMTRDRPAGSKALANEKEPQSILSPGGKVASAGDQAVLVEFRDVCKTYDGETLAVDHLNLSIARGEFVAFLGPSGSGKTTSLMMLAGFEPPTSGEILIAGRSMDKVAPHKRNIGMVFQNYALFPHMTVAENVAFPLSVRHVPKAECEQRTRRALDLVRLTRFIDRRPAELSGGQQQRVALARALVFDPLLVLMDEPLGALDKQLREQLQIEIKHIHANLGVTVVYVTHDQSEALTLSNRVAVFNEGSIQQIAPPMDIYRYPQSAFVANFVGENNQFPCSIVRSDKPRAAVAAPNGDQFAAVAVDDLPAGSPALASIRPEHVILDPPAALKVTTATLDELIYHGDHVRIRLRAPWGDIITSKVTRLDEVETFASARSVTLGWRPDDCRIFAAKDT